jgi:histidyl-tRNA synthetase
VVALITSQEETDNTIITGLSNLGITNVKVDRSLARGFDYYTGTIFEIFDTSEKNNRSLLGGGRYDNLTSLFDGEPVSGIGFGMGDVTMRDFLETHELLEGRVARTAAALSVIPMEVSHNIEAEKIAQAFRTSGVRTSVDISDKKIGKKISTASETGVSYILVVGADEMASQKFTLKKLSDSTEHTGTIAELVNSLQ